MYKVNKCDLNKSFKYIVATIIFFLLICIVLFSCFFAKPRKANAETIAELKSQVKTAEMEYDRALSEQYAAQEKAYQYQNTIIEAEEQNKELTEKIKYRMWKLYRSGTGNWITYLCDSESFNDFFFRIDMVQRINENDYKLAQSYKELKQNSAIAKAELDASIQTAKEKAEEAASVVENIQNTITQLENANINIRPSFTPEGGEGEEQPIPTPAPIPIPTPTPAPTPEPTPSNKIVERAYSCIGRMYGWGAAGPEKYDCSGLVSYCYTGSHSHVWWTGSIYGSDGEGVGGWKRTYDPVPGTCCCSPEHCGIYIGGGMMIHAPDFGIPVQKGPVQGNMHYFNR